MNRTGRTWTLILTSVAFFMVALDSLVVVTALPAIHRELGGSISTLEWTVNAFTLTYAAGIITAAALGDRSGRRLVFVLGLAVFTTASVACALAPSTGFLIAARAVQGIGAAMVMPLSLTILTAAFPAERRGAVVGIWGGIGGLAVASGPLIGGAITQGLDWHWIFWVNAPIGVVAILLSLVRLHESRGPATTLNLFSATLIGVGAAAVVSGLIRAGDDGWSDSTVELQLAAGVALVAAFLLWERRAVDAMLPLRLFRNATFTAANVTAFLMAGAIFSAAFLVAQYMQFSLGYSPLATGIRMLPWTATPLVVAPLAGRISDRLGTRPLIVLGMLMQGIGLAWIAVIASTATSYGSFVVPMLIGGAGVSMALPLVPTAVLSAVQPRDIGKASGVNSTLQRFGSAFAIAIAAAVFASNGHLGSPADFAQGFRPALEVVAGLSILGAFTGLWIGSRRRAIAPHAVEAAAA